jgi:hypothetical protein
MMRSALTIFALVINMVSALIPPATRCISRQHYCCLAISRNDYFQPHFEVTTTKNPTTVDRMIECADHGQCTMEEMDHMLVGKSVGKRMMVVESNNVESLTNTLAILSLKSWNR